MKNRKRDFILNELYIDFDFAIALNNCRFLTAPIGQFAKVANNDKRQKDKKKNDHEKNKQINELFDQGK